MKLEELTKEEKSLLLYFESRSVDNRAEVDMRHMNEEDHAIAKKWSEDGFVKYQRATKRDADGAVISLGYRVKLSDEAWKLAHEERGARADRTRVKADDE